MNSTLGVWLAAFFTLAIFSTAYKENPVYRFAEHVYVGGSAAHALVAGYDVIRKSAFEPLAKGDWSAVIPLILGIMLYARYLPSLRHLVRVPMAVMVGTAMGLASAGSINADLISQLRATILPLSTLNNVIVIIGVIGTIAYFFFTVPHRQGSLISRASTTGIWFMMVFMGAQVGMVAMGRLSLLIGRLQFLLGPWLGVLK